MSLLTPEEILSLHNPPYVRNVRIAQVFMRIFSVFSLSFLYQHQSADSLLVRNQQQLIRQQEQQQRQQRQRQVNFTQPKRNQAIANALTIHC